MFSLPRQAKRDERRAASMKGIYFPYTNSISLKQSWTQTRLGTFKLMKLSSLVYRVSTKVLLPYINLRTATTIATNLVSRYSKVTMRYTVRLVTVPPGGKQWS
ncbi:hypothetical protein AVEN_65288-1 [Araneus ventricosus]|uniref:Uncharacterized protein n=1 Tax=Araneus ventricosus TaxID=182803 RepID=A0A4Y2AG02_ARAVE|nr:hypothetical protein AVEN_65288-1 [Araneus ventricosus]